MFFVFSLSLDPSVSVYFLVLFLVLVAVFRSCSCCSSSFSSSCSSSSSACTCTCFSYCCSSSSFAHISLSYPPSLHPSLHQRYQTIQQVLENELDVITSGAWDAEQNDPELSFAFSTSCWELGTLKFHYDSAVARHADNGAHLRYSLLFSSFLSCFLSSFVPFLFCYFPTFYLFFYPYFPSLLFSPSFSFFLVAHNPSLFCFFIRKLNLPTEFPETLLREMERSARLGEISMRIPKEHPFRKGDLKKRAKARCINAAIIELKGMKDEDFVLPNHMVMR
jgi:hypothetical protein